MNESSTVGNFALLQADKKENFTLDDVVKKGARTADESVDKTLVKSPTLHDELKDWKRKLDAQRNHHAPRAPRVLRGILGGISMASSPDLNSPNVACYIVAVLN